MHFGDPKLFFYRFLGSEQLPGKDSLEFGCDEAQEILYSNMFSKRFTVLSEIKLFINFVATGNWTMNQ